MHRHIFRKSVVRYFFRRTHSHLPRSCAALGVLLACTLHAGHQVVELNGADTAQAEFQLGAAAKAALTFTFANKQAISLAAVVREDKMIRTVEKDGKKTPVSSPM